jgi:HAD superfamily hydrolase (TIGR01549 family)
MRTALIVSGGGFQGLALVRALEQAGNVRIICCDIYPENLVRYVCQDYRVAPALAEAQAFQEFLLETISLEHVNVVFPATARELMALSQLKEVLAAQGVIVAVSEQLLLKKLLDKKQAYEWLRTMGIPVPDLLDPAGFDYTFPLFGRPRHGWGGREIVILKNRRDLDSHAGDPADFVWTKWLAEFDEFSADFAIGADGAISPIVLRKRLRTSGGFAVVSMSVADDRLESLATRTANVMTLAGGRGLFNIQIIRTPKDEAFVSDVNPRIGTSSTHALGEGINLPQFFMDSTTAPGTSRDVPRRRMVKTVRVLTDKVIPDLGNTPKGVVFDLDDTLVDHKSWMFRKVAGIYSRIFSTQVSYAEFISCAARLIDEGERRQLIDRLLAELNLPLSIREEAILAYRAMIVDETPLFPDVAPALAALKAAGLRLAILTDNPPSTQQAKVSHAAALQCFDAVIYAREHGMEKPASSGFLEAARSLSADPSELVMVGDNYFRDGIGAIEAGYMHALIVRREGAFLSPHAGLVRQIASPANQRIDIIDGLLSVCHACSRS